MPLRPQVAASTISIALAALLLPVLGGTGCVTAARTTSAAPEAPVSGRAILLEHTRFSLANGLDVVIHENRAAPIVAVEVWYRAGAKHDPDGLSGLAHLVEHTMALGTRRTAPREFIDLVQGSGGLSNAATTEDHSVYFTVVPSNLLETVLWYEADRLSAPLSGLTPEGVATEVAAIRSEHVVRYQNPLYGGANEATTATLFPPGHLYHRSPFGTEAELGAATVDALRSFVRAHYRPDNATLVIAGDVDAARARSLVERYFGPIQPDGPPPARRPSNLPSLAGERRVALEDSRTQSSRLRIAWTAPQSRHSDRAAAQMLAKVLGGGRGSMLYHELVTDRALATQATAAYFDLEESGIFQIDVNARAGTSLGDIERAVDQVISRVRDGRVNADLIRRAVADSVVASVVGLQLTKTRADLLGEGAVFHDDPAALLGVRESFSQVSAADVQQAASRYLVAARMVLSMVPAGRLERVSKPELPFDNLTPVRR